MGALVVRQYRYPIGRVMTEFPAGKLDPGEDPLACGQRELLEETGYRGGAWAAGGAMHAAIAYSTEIIHIFFARGLQPGQRKRMPTNSSMPILWRSMRSSPPAAMATSPIPRRSPARCGCRTC